MMIGPMTIPVIFCEVMIVFYLAFNCTYVAKASDCECMRPNGLLYTLIRMFLFWLTTVAAFVMVCTNFEKD